MSMEAILPSVKRFIKLTGKEVSDETRQFFTERLLFLIQKMISDAEIAHNLRNTYLTVTHEDLKILHQKLHKFSGGSIRMPGEYFGNDSGRYSTGNGTGVDMATVDFGNNVARAGIEPAPVFYGGAGNIVSKAVLKDLLHSQKVKMASTTFDEFHAIVHHVMHILNTMIRSVSKGGELTYKQTETVFKKVLRKMNKRV